MQLRATLLSGLAVVAVATALAAPARAETTATSGIAQIMVLEPSDASYRLFHGAIWLDYDKKTTNYRWGGAQCKNRTLSDTNLALLFSAFRSEYQVTVEYAVSELKAEKFRCITGFTVSKT